MLQPATGRAPPCMCSAKSSRGHSCGSAHGCSAWVVEHGSTMNSMARRMFELVEPIGVIPYSADEPNEAMFALGFTDYWDTYFAGRAAPLGETTAEVVDALFYNFAPGEVARHIPKVWRTTTPMSN